MTRNANRATDYVLDSFALLAFLEAEPGAVRVQALLETGRHRDTVLWLSIINYGEVLYITERERGLVAAQKTIALIDQLPVTVVTADRPLTFAAAHIKARYPLSYADAFAVALAQAHQATIVTGDPEFRQVERLVKVEWM